MPITRAQLSSIIRSITGWAFLAAILVYGITVSRDVTLQSLPVTSKVAGWDWQPLASHPILWLLTLPLKLLPGGILPLALNLQSVLFAALSLGLLARSMQLLPWSFPFHRTGQEKRIIRTATFLAVLVCGGEYNFWQHATAETGETLDLLMLALPMWCLLEYHANKNLNWFHAAVVLWGMGMAENWAMLFGLPIFVGALIRLRGIYFFERRFIRRLPWFLAAGFSIYLVVPLVNGLSPYSPWSFIQSWRMTLHASKYVFVMVYSGFWLARPDLASLVILYLVLPIASCFIPLRSEETFSTFGVDRLQSWLYQIASAALLVACLWLAFDPLVGPRQIIVQEFNWSLPLLSFDYLTGMSAGFLLGNVLLFASKMDDPLTLSISHQWVVWFERINRAKRLVFPLTLVIIAAFTVLLMVHDVPAIMRANSQRLTTFSELAVRSLPPGGGIILGDNEEEVALIQDCLARHGFNDWLVVDTKTFPWPKYRDSLPQRAVSLTPPKTKDRFLSNTEILHLLEHFAQTNQLYCLQASFGYYFQGFQLQPEKAVFKMTFGPRAGLTSTNVQTNELFWDGAWNESLKNISEACDGPLAQKEVISSKHKLSNLRPAKQAPYQSILVGNWSSATVNSWGVELQRVGLLNRAKTRFEEAIALNPDNYAALMNLRCNENLRAGKTMMLTNVPTLMHQLGDLSSLFNLVDRYGYMDDPSLCYLMGTTYQAGGLYPQAIQEFLRARDLVPAVPAPALALIQIYDTLQLHQKVIDTAEDLRQHLDRFAGAATLNFELSLFESRAWFALNKPDQAKKVLAPFYQAPGLDDSQKYRLFEAAMAVGDYGPALHLSENQIAAQPNNLTTQINRAVVLIQLGQYTNALAALNTVLAITNAPLARFNHGIASLQVGNVSDAEGDFQQLKPLDVEPFWVNYNLGLINRQRGDTNSAVEYFTTALTHAATGSAQWQKAHTALKALQPAAH